MTPILNFSCRFVFASLFLLTGGCGLSVPTAADRSESTRSTDPDRGNDATATGSESDVPIDAYDESLNRHELTGTWEIVSAEVEGLDVSNIPGYYVFEGNQMRIVEGEKTYHRNFEMDPHSDPKRVDSQQKVSHGTIFLRAIYRLDGDLLIMSDARPFEPRPDRFVETTEGTTFSLLVARRVPDKQ